MSSDAAAFPRSLILFGVGKMGGAMLRGWLDAGLEPEGVSVIDPHISAEMLELCAERRIVVNPSEPTSGPDALVLATKPQSLDQAADDVDPLIGPRTLLISILAGKTTENLRARLPRARAIVRAMPNLPASIGRGATGIAASIETDPAQRRMAEALLACNGLVEWVSPEDLIDAVTAVSGSGPAYVFHLVECLAEAGAAAGLPPDLAQRLARATVEGAGELLHRSELSPAELRRNVTSPGGTTAAALEVLMRENGGMPDLLREAVAAAKRRAGELSG